ncbi:unnamed protein product [Vitrella brassicaformis CCMP3155]|uniref:Uncharacterized protein n=1 Tax=Vitrella brassicaformis (strain CCMP3155) TaxID=1169540 RepID=A0A0G4EC23_VITBC|nr:unnamed protein product [Vitrella brassicaformis CCMP3155]|eukprot:CEL92875.1 unnamed protein product [Vitrella brassicaformis CCMP3155]
MAIVVRREGCPDEWCLVEAQGYMSATPWDGDLHEQPPHLFDALDVGTLTWVNDTTAKLTIGSHTLTGTLTPIPKPLAIAGTRHVTEATHPPDDRPSLRYDVYGIVRSKIVFKTRPTTLIDPKHLHPSEGITVKGGRSGGSAKGAQLRGKSSAKPGGRCVEVERKEGPLKMHPFFANVGKGSSEPPPRQGEGQGRGKDQGGERGKEAKRAKVADNKEAK